jgi:hypothetical protein
MVRRALACRKIVTDTEQRVGGGSSEIILGWLLVGLASLAAAVTVVWLLRTGSASAAVGGELLLLLLLLHRLSLGRSGKDYVNKYCRERVFFSVCGLSRPVLAVQSRLRPP